MIYNTKNSKKFLLIKTLILPLLFFVTAAKAYIYKVDLLVNEQTGQEIICLNDCHFIEQDKTHNEDIMRIHRTTIIEFAKKLQATVVVESSPEEDYRLQLLLEEENEGKKKEIFRKLIEQVELIEQSDRRESSTLRLLYAHCFTSNIPCENVECRTIPACIKGAHSGLAHSRFETLAEILTKAQELEEKIAQFNDEEPFQNIYEEELDNVNNWIPILERLVSKLGESSTIPIDRLISWVKNQKIRLSDDTSYTIENLKDLVYSGVYLIAISPETVLTDNYNCYSIHNPQQIAKNIASIFRDILLKFVDMNILHAIAQNKQNPIIVTAGGAHIRHVVRRLQQCGYAVKKSVGEYSSYPPTLDLKTVFDNLERLQKCDYAIKNSIEKDFDLCVNPCIIL